MRSLAHEDADLAHARWATQQSGLSWLVLRNRTKCARQVVDFGVPVNHVPRDELRPENAPIGDHE
jgi:hypothetical protein